MRFFSILPNKGKDMENNTEIESTSEKTKIITSRSYFLTALIVIFGVMLGLAANVFSSESSVCNDNNASIALYEQNGCNKK